jgi:hypothetical protein
MATFPLSTGTVVTNAAYNELADVVREVLGVGENGWGLYGTWTTPITDSIPVRASSWDNLVKDLINNCYHHITNINTTTNTYASVLDGVSTATTNTTVGVDLHNRLKEIADYVLANRYTCAEEQFFVDPATGAKINFTGGVSERTLSWGIDQRTITHIARIRWANRLVAKYFFNTGGYLTWQPYYGTGLNGTIDQEWSDFIDIVRADQEDRTNEVKYDRAAFNAQSAGSTQTNFKVYTQGTLYMKVDVFKSSDAEYVDFIVTYGNTDSPLLVVEPTTGYWNSTV